MERLNLGKSLVLVERDNLPYTFTMASYPSYPMVTSDVTIPRQLAPTVGPMPKGVYITGEALLGMEQFAIREITINDRGECVVDDYGWSSKFDQIKTGNVIPFG